MGRRAKLSVCDKLLLAASGLEKRNVLPFTAEDLVVAAWNKFPNAFGLVGYYDDQGCPLYPDSNRVFAEIMGSKPIRKRGLLVKVGQKMYRLTETGRDLAAQLESSVTEDPEARRSEAKIGLPRDMLSEIRRLLGSRAVRKVDNDQSDSLTFHDACLFWGVTPQSSAIELEGRLENLNGTVSAARRALGGGQARLKHGGKSLSPGSFDLIDSTHHELLKKFQAEIRTIRGRTDQRRS